MSPGWIMTLTFLGTTLFVCAAASTIYAMFFRYRSLLSERLQSLQSGSEAIRGSLFKDRTLSGDRGAEEQWWERAKGYYDRADFGITFQAFAQLTLGAAGGLAVVAAFTGRWWAIPVGLIVAPATATGMVVARHRRRKRELTAQLPKALDVIGRAVRSGQTVPAAFQMVADNFESPISDEFRLCYEEQNLGIPNETALRNLARRTGVMELQILVVALLVQTRSGGNLAELLDNLATTVNKRLRLQDRVRALTGEGRMQAAVLIALPTAAFVVLYFIAHDYVTTLLEYPRVIAMSVVAQGLGAVWIRRCINFDY
jgi:tight adherence protein B